MSINSHLQILETNYLFQTIAQSEDQVTFHANAVFSFFNKLTRGLCFIQTCEKFTLRKSSEYVCLERI